MAVHKTFQQMQVRTEQHVGQTYSQYWQSCWRHTSLSEPTDVACVGASPGVGTWMYRSSKISFDVFRTYCSFITFIPYMLKLWRVTNAWWFTILILLFFLFFFCSRVIQVGFLFSTFLRPLYTLVSMYILYSIKRIK